MYGGTGPRDARRTPMAFRERPQSRAKKAVGRRNNSDQGGLLYSLGWRPNAQDGWVWLGGRSGMDHHGRNGHVVSM